MGDNSTLVTGGAGFIGTHLVEQLLEKKVKTTILDNFSSGKPENIQHLLDNPFLTVLKEDLKKPKKLIQVVNQCHYIYHFAANPEVRMGEKDPKTHYLENVFATFNLLEAIRQAKTQKTIVFASTSTIYGEALEIPTKENYAPLIPISTYGATKLAGEALITSYAYTFNHRALIIRLANIIGPKSDHGVIVDFIKKLSTNPNQLEILGDGNQEKSYLHIEDCINAIQHLRQIFLRNLNRIEIYNVGSRDMITVREIADIITKKLKIAGVQYCFTRGGGGGRGWKGDVKKMQLSIDKLMKTEWKPKYTSKRAVERTVQVLTQGIKLKDNKMKAN